MRNPQSCKTTQALCLAAACILALIFARHAAASDLTALVPFDGMVVASYDPTGGIGLDGVCGQLGNQTCGQQFSIGGKGAYVDKLELSLEYSSTSLSSCSFNMLITDNVVYNYSTGALSFGANIVTLKIAQSLDNSYGNFEKLARLQETFSPVWLAAGTYYLVMMPRNCTNGADLMWALDGENPITKTGTVGVAYTWNNSIDVSNPFVASYTYVYPVLPFYSFALEGPLLVAPTGGAMFQTARLVVGQVSAAPGGPVQVQVGFVNAATGDLLAPLTSFALNSGQTETVDLDLTPFASRRGQRIEVQPVIVQSPNLPGAVGPGPMQISATVQMFDALTGFGTLLIPVPQPGSTAPALGPQILAGGQTMRVDVVAIGPDPCVAQVAFNDSNGNSVIPAVQVNLSPGTGTAVDLDADALALRFRQQVEVQPVLTATASATAVPLNSVCNASVEVFDHFTGRTWTHQSALAGIPAVQTPAGSAVAGSSAAVLPR